jgi:hypothetical protein
MDGVVAGPAAVFYLGFLVFWGCRGLVALLLFLFARGWSGGCRHRPKTPTLKSPSASDKPYADNNDPVL